MRRKLITHFNYLKERLIEALILQYSNFNELFLLHTNASEYGLGAVLSQKDKEENEKVITYASRSMNKAELNYSITDKECLAIVWAIKHFDQYLTVQPFQVITDYSALKFLQTCQLPTGRHARWIMFLQQYNFEIVHRLKKENKNADALLQIREVQCYFYGVKILGEKSDYGTASEKFSQFSYKDSDADIEDNIDN